MQARWRWWWAASVLVHASLVSVAITASPSRDANAAQAFTEVEFEPLSELPPAPDALPSPVDRAADPHPMPQELRLGGARSAQNIADSNRGERGDGRSETQGRLLATRDDGVNLDPRLLNNLDASQEQRMRTSRTRASPQDDRRTPNPDIDPWLATGHGILLFRAPDSPALPLVGAMAHVGASVLAGSARQAPTEGVVPRPETLPGGAANVAGGIADSLAGRTHRSAGPVRTGRPPVELGHPSAPSNIAAMRPSDDVDSALLAATLSRNYVAASVQDGPRRETGLGGVGGGGAPGVGGGEARGGRAHALGDGDGVLSLSSDDDRYVQYLHEVQRRLYPLWANAFPREEMLQLHQGTVVLGFTIARDGSVRAVNVQRRSGIAAFDENVRVAVAGAHLPPIPAAFNRAELQVRVPFEFVNPAVRTLYQERRNP